MPPARLLLAAAALAASVLPLPARTPTAGPPLPPDAAAAAAAASEVRISDELRVTIAAGDEIVLSARPLPSESVDAFVKRLTDDPRTKKEIFSQGAGVKLFQRDVFVRVPYRLLSDAYKKIAIEALFPEDRGDPKGWTHVVGAKAGEPESLWRIAEWFTGDGANYREIRSEGAIAALPTEKGQTVRIPARLLLPSFRVEAEAAAPRPAGPAAPAEPRSTSCRMRRKPSPRIVCRMLRGQPMKLRTQRIFKVPDFFFVTIAFRLRGG